MVATPLSPEDQAIQDLEKGTPGHPGLGQNLDPASQNLLKYEYEAGSQKKAGQFASNPVDGMAGAWVPTNMDEEAWNAAVEAAHTFYANSDFRHMPTWGQVVDLYEWSSQRGVSLSDPRQVAGYFANQLTADQKANQPWLATGMNSSTFDGQVNNVLDELAKYSGYADMHTWDKGTIRNSLANDLAAGKSITEIVDTWKQDPNVQKKYGWIKHGMTYDQFQNTKNDPAMQQQVVARYGQGSIASDEAYVGQLGAAVAPPRSGSYVNPQSQRVAATAAGRSDIR